MADKVTIMVLKVDLECSCCYKKTKKILAMFPQIRDQVYDVKQNQVVITVVCCNPDKLRDKLCCKGHKVIKSIDIKEPPKPKPKEPENGKKPEKTREPDQKTPTPPKVPEPIPVHIQFGYPPPYPNWGCCGPCSQGYPGGPCYQEYGRPTPPPPPPPPPPRPCCGPCSQGYPGGPCYQEYGRPTPPPPPRPCYDGYGYGYGGGNRGCPVIRCDYYFSEENPQACTIM